MCIMCHFSALISGQLAVIDGTMNSVPYRKILDVSIMCTCIMRQHLDPKYTSKSKSKKLKTEGSSWPSYSLDLNLIENSDSACQVFIIIMLKIPLFWLNLNSSTKESKFSYSYSSSSGLSGTGSWGQQTQQRRPGVPLPRHRVEPKAFLG
ncbi:hypothetical protein XENORESO_018129 [Xenotaenia resolanae]|uniref:Uncharacterized protein n=1 Tax=Xenotaenia resolanae TaxID=208358 RepID=A0ABV0VXI1_9TELE